MITTILKKISDYKTEKISLAAVILAVSYFLSFLLGLLRDRLLAAHFGAGNTLDAYYTAFRIPDFVAIVLMMGAISVALIPIFTENLLQSKEKAFSYFANLLNLFLIFLIVICAILFLFTPALISVIAPGFAPDKKDITVQLTRIMFLSPILLGASNMISAVLMVFKKFLITSIAPILYNLGSIIGILFFVPYFGVSGLAYGIILGAFMHLCIQLPALFEIGFRPKKMFLWFDKDFLLTLKLTLPRAIGLAATQINLIIVTAIGSLLAVGSITVFNFANDLANPIIALLAVPFSTAVFPALSMLATKKDTQGFLEKFYSTFRQIIFLIIPASALCYLLRAHLVRVVLGSGKFDWSATKLTAACFGIFMIGLFAQGLIYLLSKSFFAIKNTFVPAMVSIISIAVLPPLAYFFIHFLARQNLFSYIVFSILRIDQVKNTVVVGLPLAISIDAIIQIILLTIFFKVNVKEFKFSKLHAFLVKVFAATVISVAVDYFIRQALGGYFGSNTLLVLFLQTVVVGFLGVGAYLVAAYVMNIEEVHELKKYLFSRLGFSHGKH